MAEYHVGCGAFGIYTGTLNAKNKNLWQSKTECTDEAINSVRDYMVQKLLGGFDCGKATTSGYEWTLKDGRVVELRVTIKQPPNGLYTAHEVAVIIADLFGDNCACNFNDIDEWLPFKCELQDCCPNTYGVACWEQYLKYKDRKEETLKKYGFTLEAKYKEE